MKRILPFVLLASVAVACNEDAPTVPSDGPQLAVDCTLEKFQNHPKCSGDEEPEPPDDGAVTVEVQLCAKMGVVDYLNGANRDKADGAVGTVPSSGCSCDATSPAGRALPYGTFEYTPESPEFEWEFAGNGFVPPLRGPFGPHHRYVLVYYPDPWPGRDLICLGDGIPNKQGSLKLRGSYDFNGNLADAKIWIVRADWVDCEGDGFEHRTNPDGVPRLTNNRNASGLTDVTETRLWCDPPCDYDEGELAYDWLFEKTGEDLITYTDTDAQ